MKKGIVLLIVVVFVFSFIHEAKADTVVKKLGRGVSNILTCPLEIPQRMGAIAVDDGAPAAATWGLLSGVLNMGKRAIVGVYEVVTFPVPIPSDYAPIITDPEFMLSEEKDII